MNKNEIERNANCKNLVKFDLQILENQKSHRNNNTNINNNNIIGNSLLIFPFSAMLVHILFFERLRNPSIYIVFYNSTREVYLQCILGQI